MMLTRWRRGLAVCSGLVVASLAIAGCGDSDESSASSDLIQKVSSIPTPEGFARLTNPKRSLAKDVAAAPLPNGWAFEPKKCAPVSVEASQEDIDAVETVIFRSTTTFITVAAYDAKTDRFELPDECKVTAVSGPGGAGGFSTPTTVEEIPGADAVQGNHSILRDSLDSPTFDQYLLQAKVRGTLRVMVVVAPLLNKQPRARHVNPDPGVAALRSAVEKLSES